MLKASRDTKTLREMMNYPFELMVGLVSLLPPLLIGLDPGTYDELRIVAELNIVFATAWATICIVGGCAVLWGLRSDLIPPIVVGLRLTSLGWVTFFAITSLSLPSPKPHFDIFVLTGAIIVGISMAHSVKLSRRYTALRRSIRRVKES